MEIPLSKLKVILLYFANNTKYLGKIKLMKLFYFLDFMHVKKYGAPVTYDKYVHLEKGPIPSAIKNLIDDAIEAGEDSPLADVVHFETPSTTERMIKMVANRRFTDEDRKQFTDTEFEILQKVCAIYGNSIMNRIKDDAHKEAGYSKTRYLENIPYSLAAEDPDSQVKKEEIEFLLSLWK